jgi:carboxyl-terminal processing protease
MMTNDRPSIDVRRDVLSAVLTVYERRVYDAAFRDSLRPRFEECMPQLLQTPDFELEVDERLRGIGIYPTSFEHEDNRKIELRRLLAATFHPTAGSAPQWVFQDVHAHGVAAKAGIRPGDVLLEIDGREIAPPIKPTVSGNGISRIVVSGGTTKTVEVDARSLMARPSSGLKYWLFHRDPHSYVRASILPGDIGYVRVAEFPGLIGVHVARQIDAAFHRVRRCSRLIVDIRGNPGGGTANLKLMTHLTPERIPVGYSLTRPRSEGGYQREDLPQFSRIPSSRLLLPFAVWKYRKLDKSIVVVTEGRKARPYDGRIALLVNGHTTSGAEIVAGFAKDHKLATLLGTRTRGTLLGFSRFQVGHGYSLTIPVSNYVTWEGTTFEHTGVVPDIEVSFEPKDIKDNHDRQMERAVATLS